MPIAPRRSLRTPRAPARALAWLALLALTGGFAGCAGDSAEDSGGATTDVAVDDGGTLSDGAVADVAATPCEPTGDEVCNGADDDCDGNTDGAVCDDTFWGEGKSGHTGFKDTKVTGDTSGDEYEADAETTVETGAFGDTTVKGKVVKKKGEEGTTFCLEGEAEAKGPVQVSGATLQVCKDAKGEVKTTFKGKLTLDGESADVTGTVEVGKDGKTTAKADKIKLLGQDLGDVTLVWGKDGVVTVTATGELDYLGQQLPFTATGTVVPKAAKSGGKTDAAGAAADGASELALTFTKPKDAQLVGGTVGVLASQLSGKISRPKDGQSTTQLLGSSAPVKLGDVAEVTSYSVDAERVAGGKWAVKLAFSGLVAPLPELTFTGLFQEAAKKACLSVTVPVKAPSGDLDLTATLCSARVGEQNEHTVTFSLAAGVGPLGTVALDGTFVVGSKQLCLQGATGHAVPGVQGALGGDATLQAKGCVKISDSGGKKSLSLDGPVTVSAEVSLDAVGTLTLAGSYDKDGAGGKGSLCVSGQVTGDPSKWLPLQGVTFLKAAAQTCFVGKAFSDLALSATFRVGKAGDPAAVVLTATGTVGAGAGTCAAKTAGKPVDAAACAHLESQFLATLDDPRKHKDARYVWLGKRCVDTDSADKASCSAAGGTWDTQLTYGLTVATAPLCKGAGGACAWSASCAMSAACTQTWTPFAGIAKAPAKLKGLGLSDLAGGVLVADGVARLHVRGKVTTGGGALTLVPNPAGGDLLTLNQLELTAAIATDGTFHAGVAGEGGLDLGPVKADLWAEGAVDQSGVRFAGRALPVCNSGSCSFPTWAPFDDVVGKGNLAITAKGARAGFRVLWDAKTAPDAPAFEAVLQTAADISLLANAKATVSTLLRGAWPKKGAGQDSGGKGGGPVFTAIAQLQKLSITAGPHTIELGKPGPAGAKVAPVLFLGSTAKVTDLTLDAAVVPDLAALPDLSATGATFDVPKGVTVRAAAEIGAVKHLFKSAYGQLDVTIASSTKFGVHAILGIDWPLIKPEHGVPGIYDAGFKQVEAKVDVDGATVFVAVGGKATITPKNKDGKKNPETLTASGFFEVDSTASIGGTLALKGLWVEPFWLPNVAVMDMGLSLKLQVAVPPYPTAFGYTGNGLLLKDKLYAPFPKITRDKQNNPVGVDAQGQPMAKLPDNVVNVGQTFYFDQAPSTSGFCAGPACLSLPPVLVRIDRQNIGTKDLVQGANLLLGFLSTLKDVALAKDSPLKVYDPVNKTYTSAGALFAPLGKHLPLDKGMPTIDVSPFSATLKRGLVYVSTHEQNRFDIDWPFGFRAKLDAEMTLPAKEPVTGTPFPDGGKTKSVKLDGYLDLDGMQLTGRLSPLNISDTASFAANPYRRVAALGGGALTVASPAKGWDTAELWVRDDQLQAGQAGAVVLRQVAGSGASEAGLELRVDELASPCAPNADTPVDLDGKPLDCKAKLGRLRLLVKNPGVAKHPLRVVASQVGVLPAKTWTHVAVVHRAGQYRLLVNGGAVGVTDTAWGKDGEAGTADDLPLTQGPTTGGTQTFGAGLDGLDDVRLWKGQRSPAQLTAWKRGLPKGYHTDPALLARYELDYDDKAWADKAGVFAHDTRTPAQGAQAHHGRLTGGAKVVVDTADQDLFFRLSLPVSDPKAAGVWLRGGMAVSLPGPLAKVIGTPVLQTAAEVQLGAGKAAARLYTRHLPLLPIPKVGVFVATGDGPNNVAGDFDDGLFFEADALAKPAPNLDASALLAFDDAQGKLHPIAGVTARLGCLKKVPKAGQTGVAAYDAVFTTGCASIADTDAFFLAKLGDKGKLSIPTGVQGDLGLTGRFRFSTLDAAPEVAIDGGLEVFGKKIAGAFLRANTQGVSAEAGLDLGSVHGVQLGAAAKVKVTYDWAPARLCGSGSTQVAVPQFATFAGNVEACFGSKPYAKFAGSASAATLLGVPLADVAVVLTSAEGLRVDKARLQIPQLFDANLKGHFKTPKDFSLLGSSSFGPGNAWLLNLKTSALLRYDSKGPLARLTAALDTSKTGSWATGTVAGEFSFVGKTPYYALVGDAALKPRGFKLAGGRFWVCKPKSKASAPAECKSTSGFGLRGVIDLGLAKSTLTGAFTFGGIHGNSSYDGVTLTGSVSGGFHKHLSLSGTATVVHTWPSLAGLSKAEVKGKLNGFGTGVNVVGTFSADSYGRPSNLYLKGSGTLKVPAPGGPYTLSSGSLWARWTGNKSSAGASGKLKIPATTVTVSAGISSAGSYAFSGKQHLYVGKAKLGYGTASFSDKAGVRFKGSLYAPFYGSFDGAVSRYGNTYFLSKVSIGTTSLGLHGTWTYRGCVYSGADTTTGCKGLKSGQFSWSGSASWSLAGVSKLAFKGAATGGSTALSVSLTGGGNVALPSGFKLTSGDWYFDSKSKQVCFKGALFGKSFPYRCLTKPGSWSFTTSASVPWSWYVSALPSVSGKAVVAWNTKSIAASSYISFGFLGFSYKGMATVNSAQKIAKFHSETAQNISIIYSVKPSFSVGKPSWCSSCCSCSYPCPTWDNPTKTCKKSCPGLCGSKPVSVKWSVSKKSIGGKMVLDVNGSSMSHKWCGTQDWGILKVKNKCVGVSANRTINFCGKPFYLPLNFSFKDPFVGKTWGYNACSVKF